MAGHVSRRPRLVGALAILVALQSATPAWAWGRLGHRVIAQIAEKRLTPKAREAVRSLLADGESMADASTWADENRGRLPKTAPWHYVDVPLDESAYDSKWSADDRKKGCVVDKIAEFRLALKDTTKPVEERRFALRFLIHLVGDMHMPMHVGDNHDRGGNDTQVRFFDRGMNMHSLWDSGIIDRAHKSEAAWLVDLGEIDTDDNRAKAMDGKVEDWATESLLAARSAYQVPGSDRRIKPGDKLTDAYFNASLPVVRERLYRGGVRLALLLDIAFAEDRPVEVKARSISVRDGHPDRLAGLTSSSAGKPCCRSCCSGRFRLAVPCEVESLVASYPNPMVT
jgi:nuclease S1